MDEIQSSGNSRKNNLSSIEFWTALMIFRAKFPTPGP